MTDSRKKANKGDYEKEQELNLGHFDYFSNPKNYIGKPEITYHPGNGLIGAKVSNMDLANNTIAIENYLRGTGSANMVNSVKMEMPDIKDIKSLNMFEKCVFMPDPFVHHRNERPTW